MLRLIIVFALLSMTSFSWAKECPKIVTQNPFDITKVSQSQWKENSFDDLYFSMLDFGMKLIEMILFSKLEIVVSMLHMD